MKIGLNLYSVRKLIQTEADFLKTAMRLKECGYSYFQFSGAPFDAEMIARVSRETVPVTLTHVPYDRIVGDTDRLMEEHDKFGCKNIGLGMMPIDTIIEEKVCKQKIEQLDRAAERMEQNGFSFFYHHHHFEFLKYGDQTVFEYMIENAPHINFTADTYWLQYGGADVVRFLERLRGRIKCVHLKDYKIVQERVNGAPRLKPDYAPLGEGTLDFKRIVQKMRELEAEYYFVEQDNAVDFPDPIGQVEISAKYAIEEL